LPSPPKREVGDRDSDGNNDGGGRKNLLLQLDAASATEGFKENIIMAAPEEEELEAAVATRNFHC
jgi:hypothetical protein